MDEYKGKTLSWRLADGVVELALDRPPANEIGLAMLEDLERFASSLPALESKASALILYSKQKAGFSAGADLRELYEQAQKAGRVLRREGSPRIPRTHSCRAQPAGHFAAHDHRGRSRRMFRRRIRAGARVRSDHRGQDGAFLLSGIAARTDPRLRRDSAAEARYRQRRGARSPADRAQHQRHQGAFRGPREPGCRGRRSPAPRARRPPRRQQNSIARLPPPRSISSSRCPRKNCAAKSTFSASSSRGPPSWRACASSSKTPARIRICREGFVGQPRLAVRVRLAECARDSQEWLSYKNPVQIASGLFLPVK